jgi:hypothetical protein
MKNVRNIILYENINEIKNKSIREQIKKLINKYKYNKSIHVFEKYTANKQDFENIILNNQKKYWSESGRKDSIRICFLIEDKQNYEFYTFSTDMPYPNNQIAFYNNCGVELMSPDEIPDLISYLEANGYQIETQITNMLNQSQVKFENSKLAFTVTYYGKNQPNITYMR